MATMARTCSQCGNNGHNSRTCTEPNAVGNGGVGSDSPGENGIMLFGVRLMAAGGGGAFRKSASMNNISQYAHQNHDSNAEGAADEYDSDDVVHASARNRDRKRGVPWTEEEHKMFLLGLQKVGKGDWRGISRNFVKSRTPTQVASHAQKYFIRRNNHNRRRRRSSLFDMTTDSVMSTVEEQSQQGPLFSSIQQPNLNCTMEQFPVLAQPLIGEDSMENLTLCQSYRPENIATSSKIIRPIPFLPIPPPYSKMAKLNLKDKSEIETMPLSLNLSITPTTDEQSSPARHSSAYEVMSDNFNNNGDSIISVA